MSDIDVGDGVLPDAADRGTLDISSTAITRIAERSIAERSNSDMRPDVTVSSIGSASFAVAASLTLPYPSEPLAAVLNRLRVDVADDLARQTGRSVSRLDLRVDHLSLAPERPARRVL